MVVRASIVEKKIKLKKLTRLLATRCGRKKKRIVTIGLILGRKKIKEIKMKKK